MAMRPVVALVGRPNTGKSSLFNRIVGRPHAIVEPTPGVTRDRNYASGLWNGRAFDLIDTGGLDPENRSPIQEAIDEQVECALEEAQAVVLLADVREGVNTLDREIWGRLRRSFHGPLFLAVNKVDHPDMEAGAYEFYGLGPEEIYPVSAVHGLGVAELLDAVVAALPAPDPAAESAAEAGDDEPRIAIVGKPNVGKSSLFNRLLGQRRAIVDDVPGTTRDALTVDCVRAGKTYRFVDTAGLRRPSRRKDNVERFSVLRTLSAIRRTDIAVLVLDAGEVRPDELFTLSEQDKRIAGAVRDAQAGCIILWNKWDLVAKEARTWEKLVTDTRRELNLLEHAPVLNCSARSGQRVDRLFAALDEVIAAGRTRLQPERLAELLYEATVIQPPPSHLGRAIRFGALTQLPGPGILFRLQVSEPKGVHFSYQRYLLNRLRQEGGFAGWPMRLELVPLTKRRP